MADIYFTDFFNVPEETLSTYGAFNIALDIDLPLFIDPFLLFASENEDYKKLHDGIIEYLLFLRERSLEGHVSKAMLQAWYFFPEVKENCFGFCIDGHSGRGLAGNFAKALNSGFEDIFKSFGEETITKGHHLEKLCLIKDRVGRDTISDFTTNLIKDYLLLYTEAFAKEHIPADKCSSISVPKSIFNYQFKRWMPKSYLLPIYKGKHLILTPIDMLTKDDTWINKKDLWNKFESIPDAIPNGQLRELVNDYFYSQLPKDDKPTKEDREKAISRTLRQFPDTIDYFIKLKEAGRKEAFDNSKLKVGNSNEVYINLVNKLVQLLSTTSKFYDIPPQNSEEETAKRIEFLKDVIENKGGHKLFYIKGKPVKRESDLQIAFRLTWVEASSDITREADDGRGPVDFKITNGAKDKVLVEFKLASNSALKRNLENQTAIYEKASDAKISFKVIMYFTDEELVKLQRVLRELGLTNDKYVYLIDARNDNKPSGSKA